MPKDEFDFEDPFELNGMVVQSRDDTTREMAETFVEEFMRMSYSHKQILALFRNPHYLGPNLALQKHGEPAVRDLITEVFARWGKVVTWPEHSSNRYEEAESPTLATGNRNAAGSAAMAEMDSAAIDPMGSPIPKLNV